jgi:ankyrin repeat protein
MAELLIKQGADLNIANVDGVTALGNAIVYSCDSIATMLIENKANLDIRDKWYNRTELHWAAIKGNKEIVELLLNHGARVNTADSSGNTPLYYAGKYGHKDIAQLLVSNGAIAGSVEENYDNSKYLAEGINIGEAVIWHLGHCGYAIKTNKHFLIFDYWNNGKEPHYPGLANGHINPEEIAAENVYVLITHEHRDHYDTTIFDWEGAVDNIKYIYGFQAENLPQHRDSGYHGPAYEYIGPREQRAIDDMHICTIAANDAGVGYVVEVDGLTLYHAGDHAGWREGERDEYMAEIDYLAGLGKNIDMAFLNATGCHSHDTVALAEGTLYTLQKLRPAVWMPTHGSNQEHVYRQFIDKMDAAGAPSEGVCLENRGDLYFYRKDKLQ